MSWVENRQAKCEEDVVYSLLGIFDIYMPLIYGEGRKNAFTQLQKEVKETSKDGEQKRILLDSLKFNQINARQMTITNAHAKTYKWLLKSRKYVDWLDTTKLCKHHGFL